MCVLLHSTTARLLEDDDGLAVGLSSKHVDERLSVVKPLDDVLADLDLALLDAVRHLAVELLGSGVVGREDDEAVPGELLGDDEEGVLDAVLLLRLEVVLRDGPAGDDAAVDVDLGKDEVERLAADVVEAGKREWRGSAWCVRREEQVAVALAKTYKMSIGCLSRMSARSSVL